MAIPRDVQNFLNSITDPRSRTQAEQTYNQLISGGASLQRSFDAIKAAFGAMTSSARQFHDELDSSLDLAKAMVQIFNRQEGEIVRAKKAMSGLVSIGQQLVDEERELDALDERRLKRLAKEANTKLTNFQIEAKNIAGRLTVDQKINANATRLAYINNLQRPSAIARNAQLKKTLEQEIQILDAYKQQDISFKAIQEKAQQRYKLEKLTTEAFGLTGAALSAAENIASRFGMSHVQEQLSDINDTLREKIRKAIELNDGKALGFGKRFLFAAEGLRKSFAAVLEGMKDPQYIMQKIFSAFLEVNVAAVEYNRLTGQNAVNQAALNSRLATSVDYLTTAAEITNRLGMSAASVFDNDTIAAIAEAKNLLGLTVEQAGSLGIQSKLANQDIDSFQDNLLKGVSAGNQLNNSLVAPGVAMTDILNSSEDITMSLGNNPEALGRAEVAARAFGMSLSEVSDIASGLLNFEDSISAELEAELMTGRSLNLERARELALTNDLEGLSQELAKNGATAAEFAKMNRLEQDSLAKALGMSREQLAESILAQEASKDATLEQRAAVMGVSKEQMQSIDIQKRMTAVLDKLAQAFAPILEGLTPVVEMLLSAMQPIAKVIGFMATGLSYAIKPLVVMYSIYKAMRLTAAAMLGIETAMNVQRMIAANRGLAQIGTNRTIALLEKESLITRIAGNAALLIQLVREQGVIGLKTWAKGLDQESIVRKGIIAAFNAKELISEGIKTTMMTIQETAAWHLLAADTGRNTLLAARQALLSGELAKAVGIAAAYAIANPFTALVGLAIAAGVGALVYSQMKDGVIDPKKGPVVSGEFGTVQLNPNDQIVAGTDLMGNKSKKSTSISQAAAKSDNTRSEIKQMREENKSLLTALLHKSSDVYMDSNKVGKSLVLGSQISS
jgi:hypothetical protein